MGQPGALVYPDLAANVRAVQPQDTWRNLVWDRFAERECCMGVMAERLNAARGPAAVHPRGGIHAASRGAGR